jgi:ankyrin repeat protein
MTASKIERFEERSSKQIFEDIDSVTSIKFLLQQKKANPNYCLDSTGNSPLHYLAEKAGGSSEVAEILLEYGADVNATNFRGEGDICMLSLESIVI